MAPAGGLVAMLGFQTLPLAEAIHQNVVKHPVLPGAADYRAVIAFFARQLMQELRLVGGYHIIYGKVKQFVRDHLFAESPVDLESPVVLRNLSEPAPGKLLMDGFKQAIHALTVHEAGSTRVEGAVTYRFLFVDEDEFNKHTPATMADLAASFTEYQDEGPTDDFAIPAAERGERITANPSTIIAATIDTPLARTSRGGTPNRTSVRIPIGMSMPSKGATRRFWQITPGAAVRPTGSR